MRAILMSLGLAFSSELSSSGQSSVVWEIPKDRSQFVVLVSQV